MKDEKIEDLKRNNKERRKKERNDINEKELKQNLEEDMTEVIIHHYTNSQATNTEIKRFVNYLRYANKDNNSPNSFINRTYSLYQYLIEQYSNFTELDSILNIAKN